MYIRCQSCGQLLYLPDDANGITVRCPACQTEFIYQAELDIANETREILSEQSYTEAIEPEPDVEPLPEFATRESYHQPRNLILQPFSSWDALFTAYKLFSEHFGVLILFALLTALPGFVANRSIHAFVPELDNIQRTMAEKETFEQVLQAYREFSETIPPTAAMMIFAISLTSFTLSIFLLIGGIRLFNAYGRKQKASFWLTLSGFDSPERILFSCFLFFVLLSSASLVGSFILLPLAAVGLAPLGIMLFIFLFMFLLVFLFFVMPLIADSNLSSTKAFQLSFMIAKRNIASLFGTLALLSLMMMFINAFVITIFGSFFTYNAVNLIAQALYEPLLVGVISVAYLKATGQFRG